MNSKLKRRLRQTTHLLFASLLLQATLACSSQDEGSDTKAKGSSSPRQRQTTGVGTAVSIAGGGFAGGAAILAAAFSTQSTSASNTGNQSKNTSSINQAVPLENEDTASEDSYWNDPVDNSATYPICRGGDVTTTDEMGRTWGFESGHSCKIRE